MNCESCSGPGPVDPAHVRSRGAGGDDTWENLMGLCRPCHTLQHSKGIQWFLKKYMERINYSRRLRKLPEVEHYSIVEPLSPSILEPQPDPETSSLEPKSYKEP